MIFRVNRYTVTPLLLSMVTASTAQKPGSAVTQFQGHQVELRESHIVNDWHSNWINANKLKELLNQAPDSILEVARAGGPRT
jgi:hypothetical protein